MKKPIIKSFDKAIVLLLFIFGVFSSCNKEESNVPEYGVAYMYGVPTPSNGEKNVVISQEKTNSIQDIQVIDEIDLQD